MDRDIPSFNRTVMDRIYAKNHQLHLKRLKDIKSSISSNKPHLKPHSTYLPHSNSIIGANYHIKLPQYNNLKREINQQTKNAQIQRENALLFQKMIKIMKRPDKNNDPVTNRQRGSITVAKQRMSMQFSKINQENRALFHRLQQQRPTIDNKKLEEERLKNLNILRFLGKYPNQEAIAKGGHNKSFDLKSRRMNSTSNRIFYSNNNEDGQQSYDEIQLTNQDDTNLIEFHNEITEYNRDMRRLKMQQPYYQREVNGKVSATMMGFNYQSKRIKQATQSHNNNSRVKYDEFSKIEIYEPVIPNRRRFLSQNQARRGDNKQQGNDNQLSPNNLNDENEMNQQSQTVLHGYHLNHPSHNIIIQDQNLYNQYKKWSMSNNNNSNNNNRMPHETDTNFTNFNKNNNKPVTIQHQRKLNSKNSHQIIYPMIQEVQKASHTKFNSQQGNLIIANSNIESEPIPIPRFATNQSKSNNQLVRVNNNVVQDEGNILQDEDEYGERERNNNGNVILLYKGVVELKGLLLQQEKTQLLRDINEDIHQYLISNSMDEMEISNKLLDSILQQLFTEISIQRLFDCYKVSINVDTKGRSTLQPSKSKNENRSNEEQEEESYIEKYDNELIEWLRNNVVQRMQQICPVQIPQVQGSVILGELDYHYKEFIKTMVRVEKDYDGQQNNNNYCEDRQQNTQGNGYKVAIVLTQKQQKDDKNDVNQLNHFSQFANNNNDEKSPHNDGDEDKSGNDEQERDPNEYEQHQQQSKEQQQEEQQQQKEQQQQEEQQQEQQSQQQKIYVQQQQQHSSESQDSPHDEKQQQQQNRESQNNSQAGNNQIEVIQQKKFQHGFNESLHDPNNIDTLTQQIENPTNLINHNYIEALDEELL